MCYWHWAQLQFFITFGATYPLKKTSLKNQTNTPGIYPGTNTLRNLELKFSRNEKNTSRDSRKL